MLTKRLLQWAVLDQSLVSAANFLSGLMIARFLGFDTYGRYTMLWGVVLFLSGLQLSVIVSPFQSIGPKIPNEDWERYVRGVCAQQIIFAFSSALLVFIGMIVVATIVPTWHIQPLALPLALTVFVTQMQEFVRRYFLAGRRALLAVAVDIIRYGSFLTFLVLVYTFGTLDLVTIFWVMVLAASLSLTLGSSVFKTFTLDNATIVDAAKRHFVIYRWLVPATIIQWSNTNVLIYFIGFQLGEAAVGIFRACQNLLAVVNLAIEGLENVLPVQAARHLVADGYEVFKQFMKRAAWLLGGAVLGYSALIMASPDYWMGLIYGRDLAGHGLLISGFALSSLIFAPVYVLHVAHRTLETTRVIFFADTTVSICLLAFASFIMAQWGLLGAVIAMIMSFIIRLIILGVSFRKLDIRMTSLVAGR